MVTDGNLSTPGVGFNRAARSLRRVAFHGRGDCWIQSLLFMSGGKPRHHAFERFAVEGDATGAQSYDDLPGTWPALRVSAQPSATNRRVEGTVGIHPEFFGRNVFERDANSLGHILSSLHVKGFLIHQTGIGFAVCSF